MNHDKSNREGDGEKRTGQRTGSTSKSGSLPDRPQTRQFIQLDGQGERNLREMRDMFDRKPPKFAAIPAGLDALQQEISAPVLPE